MSGGAFNYEQNKINSIADDMEQFIIHSEEYDLSDATVEEFKKGLNYLRHAYVYAQRADWLISGDDSEESFHTRLNSEVNKIQGDLCIISLKY